MSTITIAPHLQRALETMSKDMAVDPQALVNQAVFAWLRINGYVTPGAPVVQAVPVVVAPRIEPVVEVAPVPPPPVVVARAPEPEPEPEPIPEPQPEPEPLPEPEPEAAAPTPPEPEPVVAAPEPEAPVAEAKPVVPTVDPRVRMSAIEVDLARLTKPWAAWHGEEPAEEEEEAPSAAPPDEDARDDAERAIDEAHRALAAEDNAIDTDRHASSPVEEPTGTAGQSLSEEESLEGHTGETEVEPPPESTVVLKSNPITLYLEREGEPAIRVGGDRFIIGRGPQCDLIIDSPRVSREHAALTRAGVTYILEDLNSSNGTWYGEERVTRRELESGDTISLGNEPITFVLRAE